MALNPGLKFFKDGNWAEIPPSKNNAIFVNTSDQVEVVMPDKNGSRISIATFYNPIGDAIISPAPKLLYPSNFHFGDYLKLYGSTKLGEKDPRFESMKKMTNGHKNLLA
ncbi:1-aminocyclopropane-1-carboxylate oxidase 1-like [Gastrolobium bilobum]|uniref:1-aminocyclopropane-1-carboxylate oxidase 1-like n=1 Tax=Gastrolobium bilobum TaxID=150636 RepID=UPI002AAF10BE|nr:1-aminocyclopropane-1-carboxylate oxidase 1-like [Gastrolobium bilobum]